MERWNEKKKHPIPSGKTPFHFFFKSGTTFSVVLIKARSYRGFPRSIFRSIFFSKKWNQRIFVISCGGLSSVDAGVSPPTLILTILSGAGRGPRPPDPHEIFS